MDLRQKILLACVKKKRQKNSRKYGKTHRTLLANDCTGGVILHDLGMEFDTPTINLWMGGHDFIKYVSHLREYNLSPLVNYDEKKYCNGNTIIVQEEGAIGVLENEKWGDIRLHFQHYSSFGEAETAWKRRISRIDYDRVYIILHLSMLDEEIVNGFYKIPYKNKIIITYRDEAKKTKETRNIYVMKHLEKFSPGEILEYRSCFGNRYIDEFDYRRFLELK